MASPRRHYPPARPPARRTSPRHAAQHPSSAASSASASAPVHPPPLYFCSGSGASRRYLSPWHDVPLRAAAPADPLVHNFICEIGRGATAKFEISTGLELNPIVQDSTKAGAPRFYALPSLVNYGALPQTYESPAHADAWTGVLGDGDPLDVCDISAARPPAATGAAYAVRILGALAMLDGGECDWKLLAVRTDDPLALAGARDVVGAGASDAVRRAADAVREWFRTYKVPEGKSENNFAFGGAWLDAGRALEVIQACHGQWGDALRAAAARGGGPRGEEDPAVPLEAAGWRRPGAADFAPAPGGGSDLAGLQTTAQPPTLR